MSNSKRFMRQLKVRRSFLVNLVSLTVGIHGTFILASTLLEQLALRRSTHVTDFVIDLPLVIGLSLIYLSSLLRRRKYTAWLVAVLAYSLLMVLNVSQLISNTGLHTLLTITIVRSVVLPIIVLVLLAVFRKEFVVRSDVQGFRSAARFSLAILLIVFVYGTAGFSLLDKSDFHQEISFPAAMHYTVDQFDLTTNHPVRPYTKRAHLFVDSLSVVSFGAVLYAALSLFQPLRSRFSDQHRDRERLKELLDEYNGPSEDFFKLWPHDKHYFFSLDGTAGLAYHVYRGVALCLGDPVGRPRSVKTLLSEFADLCYSNDWQPAFIHVEDKHRKVYEQFGFELQRIGQEAIVDIAHFRSEVIGNKYFRHIVNKFNKQGYSSELLKPPHHPALIDRLQSISNEWLGQDGRVERGFVMGYFTPDYIQQCDVMVIRDAAGTIQAFINQLPAAFDKEEATFDMLRQSKAAISNSNDFLMISFINYLSDNGYARVNLGLCPLVGLDDEQVEERGLIDNFLRFAYVNGDRVYSFSGLYRFKSKYEPIWSDRYIAYQGGLRGFSRTINALMRVMRIKLKKL